MTVIAPPVSSLPTRTSYSPPSIQKACPSPLPRAMLSAMPTPFLVAADARRLTLGGRRCSLDVDAEHALRDPPDLNLLGALGDAVAAVMSVDVLKGLVA